MEDESICQMCGKYSAQKPKEDHPMGRELSVYNTCERYDQRRAITFDFTQHKTKDRNVNLQMYSPNKNDYDVMCRMRIEIKRPLHQYVIDVRPLSDRNWYAVPVSHIFKVSGCDDQILNEKAMYIWTWRIDDRVKNDPELFNRLIVVHRKSGESEWKDIEIKDMEKLQHNGQPVVRATLWSKILTLNGEMAIVALIREKDNFDYGNLSEYNR
jgi:hypothetical protein